MLQQNKQTKNLIIKHLLWAHYLLFHLLFKKPWKVLSISQSRKKLLTLLQSWDLNLPWLFFAIAHVVAKCRPIRSSTVCLTQPSSLTSCVVFLCLVAAKGFVSEWRVAEKFCFCVSCEIDRKCVERQVVTLLREATLKSGWACGQKYLRWSC